MNTIKNRSEVDVKNQWDLSRLMTPESFEKNIKEIEKLVEEAIGYQGKITENADTFYQYLQLDEKIDRLLSNVYVYAHLYCDMDTTSTEGQKLKMKSERIEEIVLEKVAFANPEILSTDYEIIKTFIEEKPELKKYQFYLQKFFLFKDHTLSKEEEEIVTKALNAFGTPDAVFYNLDNTDIHIGEIEEEGEIVEITNSNYFKLLTSRNRDTRKKAFEKMYTFWKNHIHVAAACYKGQIKEDFFYSKVKKYKSPLEAHLYADQISKDVYMNMIEVTHQNLDKLHRYMSFRKEMLGVEELHMYDVYVPLLKEKDEDIPFEEGKKILFEALKPLGEEYLTDLLKAFDERWIDIYPNKGKKSGAYQWSTYDSSPYVLLNYNDNTDSVSTMAHELGHAMHSYYSTKHQDYLYHSYPIFLAEIASTVNEVILNDYFIRHAKNKKEKIRYITEFLDKVKGTIYRQIQFAEFEMMMHDREEAGESLTAEDFCKAYYELNQQYYGSSMISDEEIKYEWARIPHFYSPFYVYQYATGLTSALALASDILKGVDGAKEKYLTFLSSGCKDYPLNILREAGVDIETKEPLEKAFEMFEEKLEELIKLGEVGDEIFPDGSKREV